MATRNPVNSPVEVGSFSHYLQGFRKIPGGCLGFLNHQQYCTFFSFNWQASWERGTTSNSNLLFLAWILWGTLSYSGQLRTWKKVRPNSKWVPGHLEVELQLITLLIGVNYNPSHWLSIAVLMVIARWWLSVWFNPIQELIQPNWKVHSFKLTKSHLQNWCLEDFILSFGKNLPGRCYCWWKKSCTTWDFPKTL